MQQKIQCCHKTSYKMIVIVVAFRLIRFVHICPLRERCDCTRHYRSRVWCFNVNASCIRVPRSQPRPCNLMHRRFRLKLKTIDSENDTLSQSNPGTEKSGKSLQVNVCFETHSLLFCMSRWSWYSYVHAVKLYIYWHM
jgi:hypothetical protein